LWFLGICLFGYLLVLGGWWVSSRAGPRPATSGAPPVVAVLPFHGSDSAAFTAGMIDALRNQTSLTVLPYESVRGADSADPVAAGRRLKASAVLAGEINQQGGGTRIQARLSETKGGAVLWSQIYDRNDQQAETTPGQIVHDLVAALRARAAADPNGRPGF